jgi:protein involved in polysaccharide export with SLBB domain
MIKKALILYFSIIVYLFSPSQLLSQYDYSNVKDQNNDSKIKKLEKEYEQYESPQIFEEDESPVSTPEASDSTVLKPDSTKQLGKLDQANEFINQEGVSKSRQLIPKPGPTELKLFGEDLFTATTSDFSPAPIVTAPSDYKLGPGDNLIVYLWGSVDLELNLTVDREGKLFVPRAGEIKVFGLTLDQFKSTLRKKLSTIYSDFDLGVMLGKIRAIRVYVYGEVKKPGGYTISSLSTLFNALYNAGGPNRSGSMRNIRLMRSGKLIANIDLYDFLLNGNTSGNYKLESEDVIFVPIVGPKITMRGQVKRSAIYELREEIKLLDMINLAGGVEDDAYLGRVMIDRINNGEGRKLIDLSLASDDDKLKNNISVKSGDDISVFGIYERRQNVVWLGGHVKHPGAYQIEERATVAQLLDDGQQLREDALLHRADLIRTHNDSHQELITINIDEALKGNPMFNLQLLADDSLKVYGSNEVLRDKYVTIEGEVSNPGRYRLLENMSISDLIFASGNLKRSAYTLTAEIVRRIPGEEIKIIYIDLEEIMRSSNSKEDIIIREDDYVLIRRIPMWDLDNFVTIKGEIKFPGKYALYRPDETLYELIQRAGGLTDDAFAFGAVFTREEIQDKLNRMNLQSIMNRANPVRYDSSGNMIKTPILDYNPLELSRMVIDLELILHSAGKMDNLTLQKGDDIYIPPKPSGVQVTGAVASSGTIHYQQNKRAEYYIDQAGGNLPHADKKELRVIRANGQVLSNGKAKKYKIGLGDIVMVPSKIKKERSFGDILLNSVSIISGIATTVFIIDRL